MPNTDGKKHRKKEKTNIQGGSYIGGNVSTEGGDFIGRDKKVSGGTGSMILGGNVHDAIVIYGDHNSVNDGQDSFMQIYQAIKESSHSQSAKEDLFAEIKDIETEVAKGELANESFLTRRLHNIRRMAPDIAEVVLATFTNPVLIVSVLIKKIAEKIKSDIEKENL